LPTEDDMSGEMQRRAEAAEQAERQRQLDADAAALARWQDELDAERLLGQRRIAAELAAQNAAAETAIAIDVASGCGVIAIDAAAQNTPKGDQPRSERGREGMEPQACDSAEGRGTDGAPAIATLPHNASPVGGPMGTGQPAAAGPVGDAYLPASAAAVPDTLMLLRDALAFTKYAAAPFFGDHPAYPDTTPEWWAGLSEQIEALQPLLIAAIEAGEKRP
jgi:hypothetical protein